MRKIYLPNLFTEETTNINYYVYLNFKLDVWLILCVAASIL